MNPRIVVMALQVAMAALKIIQSTQAKRSKTTWVVLGEEVSVFDDREEAGKVGEPLEAALNPTPVLGFLVVLDPLGNLLEQSRVWVVPSERRFGIQGLDAGDLRCTGKASQQEDARLQALEAVRRLEEAAAGRLCAYGLCPSGSHGFACGDSRADVASRFLPGRYSTGATFREARSKFEDTCELRALASGRNKEPQA